MLINEHFISATELTGGEQVGIGILEITAIPDISIIEEEGEKYSSIVERYKNDFAGLLSELYQNYALRKRKDINDCQICFELLWITSEALNQPYSARIRIFLIVRAIHNSLFELQDIISTLLKACQAGLNLHKYDYKPFPYEELAGLIKTINDETITALVKEERIENLKNQYLPYCFAYEKIPNNSYDLSRVVNSLIDYPGCAVSFQLIPTEFSFDELTTLDEMTHTLSNLNKGIVEHGVGNISFQLAEKHAETYKYYSQNRSKALFNYNIIVYGGKKANSVIANRVYAQLSSSGERTVGMKYINLKSSEVCKEDNFFPLPWAVHELVLTKDRNPDIWNDNQTAISYYKLPYIISADEASEFFRLPIGGETVAAGLVVNKAGKTSKTYTSSIINGGDIEVGVLKSSSRHDRIGFFLKDLTKHMLIVGSPGSGKTTFAIGMLDRLWKDHGIPFFVIEPAKNEYRAMVRSIPDLQVFTPGKTFLSPLVFNPFLPPKNVKLETYKSTLKTAFTAAVSMSTPLDKIFEESVNNCYSDFRWLDSYTTDDKGIIFNIADFIRCFEETFNNIGYTGDARNIGRAGVVRLNHLVSLFDNYYSIPIEDLLKKPTVIELSAIENLDQKALIIALLLLSIQTYVINNYIGDGVLKNVLLLEEAHVLLDAATNVGEGEANPSGIAQGLIKRMLAEIRAYGVGIVIADQSPRKVTTDVISLTDIKLPFRLVEATDKQIMADSMNMTERQMKRFARFKPGEAFFFFNKLDEPEEVITEDYRLANKIEITLSDEGIKSLSTYWQGKEAFLKPYPECQHIVHCIDSCDISIRALAKEIVRRIYNKNFKPTSTDYEEIKKVFAGITKLTKAELNDEPFTIRLLACVKCQMLRRVKYGTGINITDETIKATLKKA